MPALLIGGFVLASVLVAGRIAANVADHSQSARLSRGSVALSAALRAAALSARRRADALAARQDVQRAVVAGNVAALRRAVAGEPDVAVLRDGRTLAGAVPDLALRRSVLLTRGGRRVGAIVAAVPLTASGLVTLRHRAELPDQVLVFATRDGTVRSGPFGVGGRVDAHSDRPGPASIAGTRMRALALGLGRHSLLSLVLAVRTGVVSASVASARRQAILITLGVVTGLIALALVVSFVPRRRGPAAGEETGPERARRDPAEAVALLGNALAASHDLLALPPLIVELAVEATGARGGRLLEGDREVACRGDCRSSRRAMTLPLGSWPSFGDERASGGELRLVLFPSRREFDDEEKERGRWLAGQAAIALENARLHGVARRQAMTDDLTGLVNRRRFMEALAAELGRLRRFGGRLTLLLSDLDDFKGVNDSFGHDVGDAVLVGFASVLNEELREVDVAARLGGEEFAILLPETGTAGGLGVAERLRTKLAARGFATSAGGSAQVTVSIGVAEAKPGSSEETLLREADQALYQAKARGKNQVVAFAED